MIIFLNVSRIVLSLFVVKRESTTAIYKSMAAHFKTEGIKYSGSKLKLLPYILSVIDSLPVRHVLDGFSGTTRVSQALAKCGYQVTSNDRAIWSKVFGECYLKGRVSSKLQEKIKYLNSLKGKEAWFTNCLLYTSPSPRDRTRSRMPSSA